MAISVTYAGAPPTLTSTTNAASYTTTAFTFTSGTLYIVGVYFDDAEATVENPTSVVLNGASPPTMTQVGGSSRIAKYNTTGSPLFALSAWWFIGDGVSRQIVLTQPDAGTGAIIYVVAVTGADNSAPIVQSNQNTGDAGTAQTGTLATFASESNAGLAFVGHDGTIGITVEHTETTTDLSHNTPNHRATSQWWTGTDTSVTFNTGITAVDWGVIAMEIAIAPAGGTTLTIDDPGELTFTGQTINLRETELEPVTPGALTFTGQTITTSVAVTAQITTPGTLSFSGQVIPAVTSTPVTAGTLAFTGQEITTSVAVTLVVTPGTLTFTGQTITTRETVRAVVTPGALAFQGQTVNSGVIVTNTVTPGALAFAGQQVAIRLLEAITPGALTFAGQAIPTTVTGGVGPLIMTHAGPEVGGAAAGAVLIVTHEGDEAGGAASGAVHVHTRQGS